MESTHMISELRGLGLTGSDFIIGNGKGSGNCPLYSGFRQKQK